MSDENIALVRRWFEETWNRRSTRPIEELMTEESVCYADDGPMRGPEEFKARQHTPFLAAFPDLRVEVEAVLARGDQVAVRWTAEGTHARDGLGFPPTHQKAYFRGMSWIIIRDGKLREGWQSSNIPEVVRALAAAAGAGQAGGTLR